MATPIYKRILEAKKRAKNNGAHPANEPSTPIAFTAVTGKPSAAYADNTMADIVESTEKIAADSDKPDLGECVDGTNTATGKDCESPEDRKEARQQKRKDRRMERRGSETTGVGDFLRGIFGGEGGKSPAEFREDKSGATIVVDAGLPIEPGDRTPAKETDPKKSKGDERLKNIKNLTSGGPNQNLGIAEVGGVIGDVTGQEGGKGTPKQVIKGDEVEKFLKPEDFPLGAKDPEYLKKLAALEKAIKAGAADRYKDKIIPAVPGKEGQYQYKPREITEKIPGKDAEYAYNMGWADTVMQNWQQGAERRGNERNENKNMNKIWKNLTKNERNELKDVIKDMKDNGNAPRGAKNQRLAGIQEMQKRALSGKYAGNSAYANFGEGGDYNFDWGSGSQEANRNIFDTTTKSYKDKVINANRNNKGANISVLGQGGGYVQTSDEVKASESKRGVTIDDLSDTEKKKLMSDNNFGSEQELIDYLKNKEKGGDNADDGAGDLADPNLTDGGDNAFGDSGNPFDKFYAEGSLMDQINKEGGAENYASNWAKGLTGNSLKDFMANNPTGVKPDIANKDASDKSVDPNLLETDPKNTTNVVTTKNVRGQATEDMSENQKNTLNDLGVGVEDLKQREDIPIVEPEIIQEDDLKLNYKPPTKFKMKRKIGRPGY